MAAVVVVVVRAPRAVSVRAVPMRAAVVRRKVGLPVGAARSALLVAHVAARAASLAAALRRRSGLVRVEQLVKQEVCHGLLPGILSTIRQESLCSSNGCWSQLWQWLTTSAFEAAGDISRNL